MPQQPPERSTGRIRAWRSCKPHSSLPVSEHPVTPRGCTLWPATPAFRVNIGRNDTLGEHGCYYGLPTTQRSSVPPRPEEGRRCFHPDQNDRRDFIPTFLQRVSGGEGLENPLRGFWADPRRSVACFKPSLVFYFHEGWSARTSAASPRMNMGGSKLHKSSETWRVMEPRMLLIRDYQNQGELVRSDLNHSKKMSPFEYSLIDQVTCSLLRLYSSISFHSWLEYKRGFFSLVGFTHHDLIA